MMSQKLVADTEDVCASFKNAMRRLTSTVTIVTAEEDGTRFGMVATAVTSLCASPPSILVCVNQSASIHNSIDGNGKFCINLLGCSHSELVGAFSGKLVGEARFTSGVWGVGGEGIPYLVDAQANIFCTVVNRIKHGSHTIFIGDVKKVFIQGETSPLLYQEGRLHRSMAL